jgi:hypothetical protein
MEIELGSIIAASIAVFGAFATCVLYAASAKADSRRANERIGEFSDQLAELRGQHNALDNKIVDRLSAIEKSLAWIQGSLEVKKDSAGS